MKIKFLKKDKNLFEKLKISCIFLFGSKIKNLNRKNSDIDIGIYFERFPEKNKYFKVLEKLHFLFYKIFKTDNLDIVFFQELPYDFQADVVFEGKPIYLKNKEDYKK